MTQLTRHFSLDEFVVSQTASRKGLDNTPPAALMGRLQQTAERLEEVRVHLARPILISSGYRSAAVNKAVGGVPSSAHVQGYAVDFICPGFGPPPAICRSLDLSGIPFDQLIEEGTWVHISFDPRMRRRVLTKIPGGYQAGLTH